MTPNPEEWRPRRTLVRVIIFLGIFLVVLLLTAERFLIPALIAARDATPEQKRELAAISRLVLALLLFVLMVGLLIAFRIGRFFFPRAPGPRTRTQYTDAWTESAKRLKPPDPLDEDEE